MKTDIWIILPVALWAFAAGLFLAPNWAQTCPQKATQSDWEPLKPWLHAQETPL